MPSFTYSADFGAKNDMKPTVTNIKFGDGYVQRASFGMNQSPQMWSLSFANRSLTEADDIEGFFLARAGTESFDWTPPGTETSLKFICQEWSRTVIAGGFYTITAKFQQVFEP